MPLRNGWPTRAEVRAYYRDGGPLDPRYPTGRALKLRTVLLVLSVFSVVTAFLHFVVMDIWFLGIFPATMVLISLLGAYAYHRFMTICSVINYSLLSVLYFSSSLYMGLKFAQCDGRRSERKEYPCENIGNDDFVRNQYILSIALLGWFFIYWTCQALIMAKFLRELNNPRGVPLVPLPPYGRRRQSTFAPALFHVRGLQAMRIHGEPSEAQRLDPNDLPPALPDSPNGDTSLVDDREVNTRPPSQNGGDDADDADGGQAEDTPLVDIEEGTQGAGERDRDDGALSEEDGISVINAEMEPSPLTLGSMARPGGIPSFPVRHEGGSTAEGTAQSGQGDGERNTNSQLEGVSAAS